MKKLKVSLSILLAFVMAFSALPITALADSSDPAVLAEAQALVDAKNSFTSKQNNVSFDGSNLKAGTKVIFDTSMYTLTVNVTKVNGTKITINANIAGKFGSPDGYKVSLENNWMLSGTIKNGKNVTDTFDTNEAYGGTNYLKFGAYCGFADTFDRDTSGLSIDDYVDLRDAFDGYYEHNHYLCFAVKEKVTLSGAADATKNSVTLGDRAWDYHNEYGKSLGFSNIKGAGTVVYYKPSTDKKWKTKTFKSGSLMKLTGLKASTKYNIKCKYFTTIINPENNKTVTTYCDYYNSFNIFTASAKALKVKSIKTSKYKVTSYKRNAYSYWSGNKWTYVPAKTIKSKVYKVTVKVSNVPKNTKGIMLKVNSDVNTGRYVKYNKKKNTYTFTVAEPLKTKGKKRTAKVYAVANGSSSWGIGLSPAAKKTIKIKK